MRSRPQQQKTGLPWLEYESVSQAVCGMGTFTNGVAFDAKYPW